MAIEQISVQEAASRLASGDGTRYLDVRSVMEFDRGHPPGAINVPLLDFSAQTQRLMPNPGFLRVVSAHLSRETPILVACAAGGRSKQAAMMLVQAGYTAVADIPGGYSGQRNAFGEVLVQGWVQAGLPTTTEAGPGEAYSSLTETTD